MPSNISILIVEDDLSFALELDMLVQEIGYTVAGRVDNAIEALTLIFNQKPDLILMDIDIKGELTGIELAKRIRELDIPILFITSFRDEAHYEAAKATNFVGYLVKPLEMYSLRSSIELAIRSLQSEKKTEDGSNIFSAQNYLFFKKRKVFQKIWTEDILYLEADGNYVKVITPTDEFIASTTITRLSELLDSAQFMQVHRSFLINLKHIRTIDPQNNLVRIGDHDIPISRSFRKSFFERMPTIR